MERSLSEHEDEKHEDDFFSKEKRIFSFPNYRRNEDKPKYLFLNHRRNEDKLMHSSLNYRRNEEKRIYSFNKKIEGTKEKESICSSTIEGTNRMHLFLNYRGNEENRKYSFLNYRWFDVATQSFTGQGPQHFGGFFHWIADLSTKSAKLPPTKAVGNYVDLSLKRYRILNSF